MVNNIVPVCTVEEVREEFRRRGISVSDWARRQGVSAQLTYRILSGRTLGLRGQSHTICVLLGLKPGVICSANDLKFAHARGASADAPREKDDDRPTQPC
ncbi:DNA-binding protein [Aquabacterium olei]|uniref:DNA-binding protein n=1 Tax=Aquabacterium olei TaxID=1296669 RepID=A0A2U8FUR8_9BURK|nr:DNA-binding protein [Aquabacterium olei]AWI54805.1 DNA-binding protein [Aquabacterium olei]